MHELQFEVETVTPLFLGGPQPRPEKGDSALLFEQAELRVPSLRGALRYWLRTALPGAMGTHELAKIKEKEAEVFGNTQNASDVRVRAKWSNGLAEIRTYRRQEFENGGSLQIPQAGKKGRVSSGRNYLLWSMRDFRNSEARKYFAAGEKFTVTLSLRPAKSTESASLVNAARSLWLLGNLGGLGSRSRRCAGSLEIMMKPQTAGSNDKLEGLPEFKTASSPEDLTRQIGDTVKDMLVRMGKPDEHASNSGLTPFDTLHRESCRIIIIHGEPAWNTWQAAMEHVGVFMSNFRYKRPNDDPNVRNWILYGEPPQTVERAAFGLPLPFSYSKDHSRVGNVVVGQEHERRSSPLHLKITKLDSGEHVGVATCFKSNLLPEGEKLRLQSRDRRTVDAPVDLSLIDEFFDSIPTKHKIEVEL